MNEPRASRAGFPGYGITTDAEGMLPWSWAVERLAVAHNYWVATASAERGPHAMPVWGLWYEDAFVFSTGAESRKARNLAADPRVVVHLESGAEVVIVEGEAEQIEATPEILAEYERKYGWRADPNEGWYRVGVRRVLAWREADFPRSTTRFDLG